MRRRGEGKRGGEGVMHWRSRSILRGGKLRDLR